VNLYVVRHGQTIWNSQNKVCGNTDVELTDKGKIQAETLAEYISDQKIELDIIFTSPLKRAMKTAEIIGQRNGIEVISDQRLIEQNYGIFEGVDRKNDDFLKNKRNFAYRYPGGESMMQVACRIYRFLDEIKIKYQGKNVLIVSHGGVCRIINTYFDDMTNDEFFHWQMENAQIKKYKM